MLLLNRHDVESLLEPDSCLEAMEEVMVALSEGRAIQPLRTVLGLHGDRDSALFMPATLEDPPVLGTKVVTIYPTNHEQGIASHHGAMLLFEAEHGRPVALLDGSSLTAIRTAAVTAMATRLLAPAEARVLAILGTGVQARSHLDALLRVCPYREIRIWSPSEASRSRFLEVVGPRREVRLISAATAEEAVRGAHVVTTVTSSPEPVLRREWLATGSHVNAVGASTATTREIDTETVEAAHLFVDHRNAALSEAGELLIPIEEGRLDADHIQAEIGEVASGAHPGRTSVDQITLFRSVGLAVQDLAAAALVVARAERRSVGQSLDWI